MSEDRAEFSFVCVQETKSPGPDQIFARLPLHLKPVLDLPPQLSAGESKSLERSAGLGIQIDALSIDQWPTYPGLISSLWWIAIGISCAKFDGKGGVYNPTEDVVSELERKVEQV